MRTKIWREAHKMSEVTHGCLVEEARKGFRAKAKQFLNWHGKCEAIRKAGAYFGLSEHQARRIYSGRLKTIDALPYVKITNWYREFEAKEARLSEHTQQIAQLVLQGIPEDAENIEALDSATAGETLSVGEPGSV